MTMITLTTEQAQQIEEALEDIVRVFKFETGTPVEALATIRAARAQEQAEQEPVAKYMGHRLTPEGTKEFWGYMDKPLPEGTLLYTRPVRTTDLTDDEIDGVMWIGGLTQKNIRKFARAVIAADRRKNK